MDEGDVIILAHFIFFLTPPLPPKKTIYFFGLFLKEKQNGIYKKKITILVTTWKVKELAT